MILLQALFVFYCTYYTRYFEVSFFSTRSCVPGAGLAGGDAVSDRLYRRGEGPDRESLPRYQAPRPPTGMSQKSLLILKLLKTLFQDLQVVIWLAATNYHKPGYVKNFNLK